jgi:hypothetical protein
MHGYPPQPHYHLLFTDSPDAPKFRLDYFRTINNLFENNFSKKLGDWCKSKGIDLTGHYMCEHSMYTQQLWGTKVMANYRHQGVPGIDHLGRQIDERISAKQCQSVVNQYGKKRMISELYGCSGQNVSFEDRFWISAQQICLGVNMLNPHLSLYTMVGCRKRDFPPNIFCQQPWWPINTAIDKPLSRMCAVMSKGAYYPEALIIHPQESTFVLWQSKDDGLGQIGANYEWDWQPVTDSTKADIETLDSNLKNLMNEMLGAQRTFDFGDETIIADCGKITTSKDETVYLNIGNMSYPVIILPDMVTISLSTFELLKKFKSAGGHLVRCGKSPKMLDGKACKELDDFMQTICFVETAQIGSKMKDFLMPAVEIKNAADIENSRMLWAHIRDLPEGQRMVYLVNLDRKSEFSADISFAGKWNKAEILNIWTGEIEALCNDCQDDLLSVKLPFAQAEAKILLLSKDENYSKITKNSQPVAKVISLDNVQWDVNLLDDNSLTLDYVHYQKGNSQWSKAAVPITALQKMFNEQKYAGQLSLRYTFVKNKAVSLKNVRLVIEHPEYYQTIINGNEARYGGLGFWKDPRWSQIDISKFLVDGDNTIELNCDDFRYGDLADVENPSARYGTEIESIYIVGDFAVRSDIKADNDIPAHFNENNLPPAHIRNAAKDSFVIDKPSKLSYGDLTTQNLPFYAGRVSLKADLLSLDITSAFSQAVLKLDYMDCPCIEVKIGNESLGCLIGKMSSVDITDKIGKASQLELVFYGSLRNLLGPHHHTDKEPIFVSPESFIPHFKEQGSFAENFKKWMDNKIKPFDWLNEYYLVSFGIVSGLRIEFK